MSVSRCNALPATQQGIVGESLIARWLRARGCTIIPAYEKEIDTGKGPRLFAPDRLLVAPDMLTLTPFPKTPIVWVEAKHKDVFSWYRIGGYWTTGIDLKHYRDYCAIADTYPYPVHLFFLHRSERSTKPQFALDPWPCPTGLFSQDIAILRANESHRSDRHGRSGMVYWNVSALRFRASLADVQAAGNKTPA